MIKHILLSVLLICCAGYTFGQQTTVEVTDVSSIDNVIYIEPFTATKGQQTTVSIKMKNTVNIRGFQFDLYLPEGMTAVKSSKGRIQGSLTEARLPEEDEHNLTFSNQPDGAVRFLCSSLYSETFTGNDGEIATLQVQVSDAMQAGDYAVTLKKMILTQNDISLHYKTDELKTKVTTTEAYILLDETSTTIPEATSGAVDIKVKRKLKAGEWSTICLPFAMTEAQVKEAFGSDVQLKEFIDYDADYDADDNVTNITVNFENADLSEGLYGNYPYLIKVSTDIDEFTVNSTIEPNESRCHAQFVQLDGGTLKVYGTFQGTLRAQTTVPGNGLFLSDNKFWYSTGQTKMKAFRGYFMFEDVLSSLDAASARINLSFSGSETTGVSEVVNRKSEIENWYDLQGRRVENPAKGLYIKRNKKVIVR